MMRSLTWSVVLGLFAAALPAQTEKAAEKKAEEAEAAEQRAVELQRLAETVRKIREAEEKALDAKEREVLERVILKRMLEQAIVLEKEEVPAKADDRIRALLSRRLAVKPSPLMKGDYQKAVEKLEAAQRAMRTAEDPDAAMRAIDEASKALMEARAAAWKNKDEEPAAKAEKRDG